MAQFGTIGLYAGGLLLGLAFVLQQTVNASLRDALSSPYFAGLINFLVGGAAMVAILLALREPVPSAQALARAPWYAWTGGLLGLVYVVGTILLIPKLGAASVIGLFVVGQILAALAFDHFGVLGLPVREFGLARLGGAGLMVAGVVLISRF